eukprot:CAMPEP_0182871544 /NCGR_PEP_ID=MMETSP0034_2-20130328/11182_1 /TAXON_ID=156128 /ORGANISM="Nephroselmis pyriformis, Strain CCMP717" /LENGTH=558 /DNA_ID=CAMNT_0025004103 /DNA_START=127 /DNA_END=1800 /DNA_ORIENTATION=+
MQGAWWLIAAVLVALAGSAAGDVVAVYSIQRHGAREHLKKSDSLEEFQSVGGPTLLSQGEAECFRAGEAFRRRYLESATCAATRSCMSYATTAPGAGYGAAVGPAPARFHNRNVYARSTSLDRTLLSAESFFTGVFPPAATDAASGLGIPTGEQLVPIYSVSDAEDIALRGYTKCPSYHRNLSEWYGSAEFRAQEEASAPLRARVAAAMRAAGEELADGDLELARFWNVFDAFHVARNFGQGDMPAIADADYAAMEALAHWLETRKMRPTLGGGVLGRPLLADVATSLARAEAGERWERDFVRIVTVSSHYHTMLSVLAALGSTDSPWATSIPPLSSSLAFELHVERSSGSPAFAVRLVGQDGGTGAHFTIPLPCEEAAWVAASGGGGGACTWDGFQAMAGPRAMTTEAWCEACGLLGPDAIEFKSGDEGGVTACHVARLEARVIEPVPGGEEGGDCSNRSAAVAGVASCLVTLAVATLAFAWFHVTQRRYWLGENKSDRAAVIGNPTFLGGGAPPPPPRPREEGTNIFIWVGSGLGGEVSNVEIIQSGSLGFGAHQW